MELRLPLEMSPGREAACRAVFGTWRFSPNDARKNCPFVLTSFTGWCSERCPGIGFLSRGDREIGVLRNVEPPTRPRLECLHLVAACGIFSCGMWDLVLQPGIEPRPPKFRAQNLHHWMTTREVPSFLFFWAVPCGLQDLSSPTRD